MIFNIVYLMLLSLHCVFGFRSAFDQSLYQNVLDPELCDMQLRYLFNNTLGLRYLDSSGRLPSGILSGNFNDLGDYHQCLSIHELQNNMDFHGKYCAITLPFNQQPIVIPDQWPEWPNIIWPEWPNITLPEDFPNITLPDLAELPWSYRLPKIERDTLKMIEEYRRMQQWAQMLAGVGQTIQNKNESINNRIFPMVITSRAGALLGVCVPKVCTATQAVNFLIENVPFLNLTFNEFYCRLPDDKPLAPADYVAFVVFSLIVCLAIVSTSYDLYCVFAINVEPSSLIRCFSIYTNTRRFLTFNKIPGALECVDGIRAISMMWVVVGHTYSMTLLGFVHNLQDTLAWLRLFSSTWVNSAPLTVDTFFLLSGILAVYATIGKISRARFIRTVHLFYINRLLRMFPLLAAVVLLQASVFNYVSDGPFWQNVAHAAENCRRYWWAALLHVQNYVNSQEVCLAHTWYLSVDTQLYIVSPLLMVWMFGTVKLAWCALCLVLLLSLVSTSVYSFTYNFSAALVQPNRVADFGRYVEVYYINTLTRAPPFFIGMIYGYLLHLCRGRKVRMSRSNVIILWALTFVIMSFCVFSIYPVMQLDHDAQMLDNFLNAYMRSLWAGGLGWIIFACVQGYGGPVNWFLSLKMWKLPARLSYAMYLIHLPIIMIANSSWTKTHYFTNGDNLYRFTADLMLTFVAAFILCIMIDAPFSTLQKALMGSGKKRPVKAKTESQEDIVEGDRQKTTL